MSKVEANTEGIQRFKSRFGATLTEGYAFRVVFSPYKFIVFQLMIRLYFVLKGWKKYMDPIDQLGSRLHEKK